MERSPQTRPRHLAAVWLADIVGFSRLASRNEDLALRVVSRFQDAARAAVESHGGRLVKFVGDAALAEFSSTEAAALSAQSLRANVAPEVQVRIGLHVGDVFGTGDGDILGDGVNLAARLQTEALAGEILVSEQAWHQLRHRETFEFADGGSRRLKGQPGSVQTYELLAPSEGRDGNELHASSANTSPLSLRPPRTSNHWRARLPGWSFAPWLHKIRPIIGPRGLAWTGALLVLLAFAIGSARAAFFGAAESSARPMDVVSGTSAPLPEYDASRVAVLYFDDHSPGKQLDYLANGLTEALIHELSGIDALEVISRGGVKPFKNSGVPFDSIVRALRVGSVVEGSITQSENRVRLTVQLISGATGAHLESRVVERERGELFALQDALIREVTEVLRRELGREIRTRETRRGTESQEAYDLLMRSALLQEEYSLLRSSDESTARLRLAQADSILEVAQQLDPNWTEPIVRRGWLARAMALLDGPLPGQLDSAQALHAISFADQAIALKPEDAVALELRGVVKQEFSKSQGGENRRLLVADAESDLRRATQLDERRARAWWALSELLLGQARFEEAKSDAQHALEADAFLENAEEVHHQIYYAAVQMGPGEEAATACNEGRQRYPNSDEFIVCQLFMLASFPTVRPDVNRAVALADTLTALASETTRAVFRAYGNMFVAQVAARAKFPTRARHYLILARGDSAVDWLAYNEAHVWLQLGDPGRAVDLLSRHLAYQPGDSSYVARDWWFEELHSFPAFQDMFDRRAPFTSIP